MLDAGRQILFPATANSGKLLCAALALSRRLREFQYQPIACDRTLARSPRRLSWSLRMRMHAWAAASFG
jgi:hypothetical protein